MSAPNEPQLCLCSEDEHDVCWDGRTSQFNPFCDCCKETASQLDEGSEAFAAGLTRDLKGGSDYTLPEGESCWVSVGNASVYIQHGSEGVGVSLYPKGRESDDSVTETWATWSEFECDDCGRKETECSVDPCAGVITDREE